MTSPLEDAINAHIHTTTKEPADPNPLLTAVTDEMKAQDQAGLNERQLRDAEAFLPSVSLERAIALRDSDPEQFRRVFPGVEGMLVARYSDMRRAAMRLGKFSPETFAKENDL